MKPCSGTPSTQCPPYSAPGLPLAMLTNGHKAPAQRNTSLSSSSSGGRSQQGCELPGGPGAEPPSLALPGPRGTRPTLPFRYHRHLTLFSLGTSRLLLVRSLAMTSGPPDNPRSSVQPKSLNRICNVPFTVKRNFYSHALGVSTWTSGGGGYSKSDTPCDPGQVTARCRPLSPCL